MDVGRWISVQKEAEEEDQKSVIRWRWLSLANSHSSPDMFLDNSAWTCRAECRGLEMLSWAGFCRGALVCRGLLVPI